MMSIIQERINIFSHLENSPESEYKDKQENENENMQEITLSYLKVTPQTGIQKDSSILFLHGILGDARTWLPYLHQFSKFETIALTQSGFGQDTHSPELFDTQRHAKELIAFCKALNQQENRPKRKFIIVAWSYACHVSLLAAKLAPELFKSLTLYELIVPSYGISEDQQTEFTKDLTKMMSPIIKAYRRGKPAAAVDHFISACKNAQYSLSDQKADIQQIKQENAASLSKLLTQKEPEPITPEALLAINQKVPITIFYGGNSRDIFQISSQAGMKAIGQSKGMIEDADHLLPEENPQKLIALLQDILTQ